ncbi:patatin-like phospholipase family protein [Paracoccus fistulariae]|uniref:Patatin-like phospholipase family protein n=1 Tax=Paracoccus fistulariae TaxID=658446 RepID=A0ABY7SFF9_9RHOB|nr:patatin-like phospholipase family protein [Paracoccus fistulariae]MDB6182672.1 patatin-like phospholipase family protein [Paracoccus fistulariae]WCR05760.1 patatin-like phospholipase family protein [Paracoccus fistulariae]
MTFRLLSCDGGGIRGYISSTLIARLNKDTGGKLLDNIDGYAGTSTGGLISIALAAKVSIDTMVSIYENDAGKIFTENSAYFARNAEKSRQVAQLAQQPLAGPGIFECQYTANGLHDTLLPYLGQTTFGDITDKLLVINAARLDNGDPAGGSWTPAYLNNCGIQADYSDISLLNAALATSAAPTYFPPHNIPGLGFFADGGTFANNPVLNGVLVALASGRAATLSEIEVLSFGTGSTPVAISEKAVGDPLSWGVTRWLWPTASDGVPATPLLGMMFDLSANNIADIAGIIPNGKMVRINPPLPAEVPLDGYSAQDYHYMQQAIDAAINSSQWQDAVALVNSW